MPRDKVEVSGRGIRDPRGSGARARTSSDDPVGAGPAARRPRSDARAEARMALLRRWAVLLDSAFRIPGTSFRFGLDPILGLIPGLGDLSTPVFSTLLLFHAFRLRVPKIVQARMLLNVALDAAVGWIPVAGDLFDFGWKANARNLALLEQHLVSPARPTKGDWIFVAVAIGAVVLCALVPLLLVVWLLRRFPLV